MKDFGLVSIVTPNYNCERFVAKTIKSVLNQTYQSWELLIQDDCSTDNSINIIMELAKQDPRIKVEKNSKNSGAAVTRNNCIKRSKGGIIAYLDSDDVWLPNKLERQLDFMEKNNCDFVYSSYELIDEDDKSLGLVTRVKKYINYNQLMIHWWPGCLTIMHKQDVNNKLFCPDIKKSNDRALFFPVVKQCNNAMGMNDRLALYRIRKGSISRKKTAVIKPFVEVTHKYEGKNIICSYFYVLTHMIIKKFFKMKRIKPEDSIASYMKTLE